MRSSVISLRVWLRLEQGAKQLAKHAACARTPSRISARMRECDVCLVACCRNRKLSSPEANR